VALGVVLIRTYERELHVAGAALANVRAGDGTLPNSLPNLVAELVGILVVRLWLRRHGHAVGQVEGLITTWHKRYHIAVDVLTIIRTAVV
jgi:hypothetical protein